MLNMYYTDLETGKFEETKMFKKGVWINMTNPSAEEIKTVCSHLKIEEDFIRYPLDLEEQARIDIEDDMTLFVIDVPVIEKSKEDRLYSTMPLGMIIVRDDYFITVSSKRNRILDDLEKQKFKGITTYKKTRLLLQILFLNSSYYLNDLKRINRAAENTIAALQQSMKNKDLIQLSNYENSLVYITTSLKANEIVMEKTLRGKIIKMYDEDEDILEDAIIENKQAIEMSKTYTDILSRTMDTYASIISNNLNVVMKFLTSVTIVLSIPTLIASVWGMNVNLPFQSNPYGFLILIGISAFASTLAYIWLKAKDMI